MKLVKKSLVPLFVLGVASMNITAGEKAIGDAVEKHGMSIGAVYLQSVVMHPHHQQSDSPADIHLEADISVLADNPYGFEDGAWMPYLTVEYEIKNKKTGWSKKGEFVPMVANDGPHYGANIKMDGVGEYSLHYRVLPPDTNGFYRHTDKETGVSAWWEPVDLNWEFVFLGAGKKGGY